MDVALSVIDHPHGDLLFLLGSQCSDVLGYI